MVAAALDPLRVQITLDHRTLNACTSAVPALNSVWYHAGGSEARQDGPPGGHPSAEAAAAIQPHATPSHTGRHKHELSWRRPNPTSPRAATLPQHADDAEPAADDASSHASGTSSGIKGDVSSSSVEHQSEDNSGSFCAPQPRNTTASHRLLGAHPPSPVALQESPASSPQHSPGSAHHPPNPRASSQSSLPASDATISDPNAGDGPSDEVSMSLPVPRDFFGVLQPEDCLLYTSPSPRDRQKSRMPSSA